MSTIAAPASADLASFTRMDESTRDDWMKIARATVMNQQSTADRVIDMLRSFDGFHAGFGVSQLHHALQSATMAVRANASDELVLCALCHDLGKYVSIPNHGAISAEILRPYVSEESYRIVLTHQDFQGQHYYGHFGKPGDLRERYRAEPWFAKAEEFTDDWDQAAFDPQYKVMPLGEFEPLVRQFLGSYPVGF
jgi:predicted HD phosphohydrolase